MTDQARDEALRNDIARTIHDGPSTVIEMATMMIAPHSWEDCPHKATYLGDADALVAAGYRKDPEPYDGESEPIARNPVLRGVDLAMDRLVRSDCFTEQTLRILDALRAEVLGVSSDAEVRAAYRKHDCEDCTACLHDGHKCCGCYDGVCCEEGKR